MHLAFYTNIPLNENIEFALDYILSNNSDVNISRKYLKKLLAMSKTYFYFNGDISEQVAGVVMDSLLAPSPDNLFMGHHEQHWLIQEEALSVL